MMKIGTVSGGVKTRSIEQQMQHAKRVEKNGAGDFCAVFASSEVYGKDDWAMEGTFLQALGKAAAAGITSGCVSLLCFLTPEEKEDTLRKWVRTFDTLCTEWMLSADKVEAKVSASVSNSFFEIAVAGKREAAADMAFAEKEIIAVGYLGAEGSMLLAKWEEQLLTTRYQTRFIKATQGFSNLLRRIPEAATAMRSNLCVAKSAGEGGILRALWELAEEAGVGLTIDLKALPVRQETIEVCNFLDLNPYDLLSTGVMVAICSDAGAVVERLGMLGIPAVVVGKTTATNDRVLCYDEEKRFMEPGKVDEIYKRMENIR